MEIIFSEPQVIAKSNIILDVKPWDDETDMKEMERLVRSIQMDGLLWGAGELRASLKQLDNLWLSTCKVLQCTETFCVP